MSRTSEVGSEVLDGDNSHEAIGSKGAPHGYDGGMPVGYPSSCAKCPRDYSGGPAPQNGPLLCLSHAACRPTATPEPYLSHWCTSSHVEALEPFYPRLALLHVD
jgi:hypothetical protein